MFDFIGDVHGHADRLEALLNKLGYLYNGQVYSHPKRKAFFVGDYIDRGPKIPETLKLVRRMVEGGHAIALMGNHEYNALCFHYTETEGGHLRKHLISNIIQHYETLKQFQNRQSEYEDYLEWFKTLPLFYETIQFRAVHACWDIESIRVLREQLTDNRLTDQLIVESAKRGTPLHHAIDITLKGMEVKMPVGHLFTDKDGTHRTDIRIKWWEDPSGLSYKKISIEPIDTLPEAKVDCALLKDFKHYPGEEIPVFFGHYWLKGSPLLYMKNICCLDYSVAKQGHLVAYRFDGERRLEGSRFVYV